MSISPDRLHDYAKYLSSDEECLAEVARRMSVRYYTQFCDAAKSENVWALRAQAAAKQDLLNDFIRELKTILADNTSLNA